MSRFKAKSPNIVTNKLILPEHIERQREHWTFKAIKATRGNQTHIGRILLAAMGKQPDNPPRFAITSGAIIINERMAHKLGLKEGDVLADFQARPGEPYRAIRVCHTSELNDNFRGLADHLKLTDADRIAMFDVLRQWVWKDYTATSSTEQGERGETDADTRH